MLIALSGEFPIKDDSIDIILDEQGKVLFQDSSVREGYKYWEKAVSVEKAYDACCWNNQYEGGFRKNESCIQVGNPLVPGHLPLPLEPSLKIRNHSPDGFSWGYHGSGPAQAALALLLYETGDADLANAFYQDFKCDLSAKFDMNQSWSLTGREIRSWLWKQAAKEKANGS